MEFRTQALDKLAEVLERRLVSSKRGARFRFSACAAWSQEESSSSKEDIPASDVRQCRDAVKMFLGQSKARTESVQRSTLRHLVLLKTLPSESPLHDKRLIDAVAELRKRLGPKLLRLCHATSSPASDANSSAPTNANSNASTSANSNVSVSKTPRHDLGASISHEECLRRRVLELEKELEDAKQRLEKLVHAD